MLIKKSGVILSKGELEKGIKLELPNGNIIKCKGIAAILMDIEEEGGKEIEVSEDQPTYQVVIGGKVKTLELMLAPQRMGQAIGDALSEYGVEEDEKLGVEEDDS